jgi:uncharacterized protein (DUF58 family)
MTTATSHAVASWRPTVAYRRAAAGAVVMVACALIFRRPDLLVIATPLALLTAWSLLTRPTSQPAFDDALSHRTVREGDTTVWHCAMSGELDLAVATLTDAPWIETRPASGVVSGRVVDDAVDLEVIVRSTRWGTRSVGPFHVIAASPWASFRWSIFTARHPLTTLPIPALFDVQASLHPTDGLIGMHRSARSGEGNEFAGIRQFRAGDRLRRINWTRSARTNSLMVNSTWADLDTHIALVIDATDDFGVSEGIDGLASSMDWTVRAAGAIAEHYAPRGERVSLRTFGTRETISVPPRTGQAQLRRILDALARVHPAGLGPTRYRNPVVRQRGFTRGQLTVVLSPLIAPDALDLVVSLGQRGMSVIVVDTLPVHIAQDEDPDTALAWRIRLLERRRELRVVTAAGIPVVAWRGPGSLDQVIRDIARRSTAPRVLQR